MSDNIDHITFSKSRLVYYNNDPANIVDTDADWKKITVTNSNASSAYKICTVPADMHNWHQVPTNTYGLYASFNEYMLMLENFQHIQPVSCNVSVSHCVPLAKYPGTANTTQLSFNNTIFSLVYDLYDTDMVQASTVFPNKNTASYFYQSFDGSNFQDRKRVLLPKNPIQYKIPYPEELNSTTAKVEKNNDLLKRAYYPDFLQDNTNVKALYPGENIDIFNFSNDENAYGGFDTGNLHFGENFTNFDIRAWDSNKNIQVNPKIALNHDVFPSLRGPTSHDATNETIGNSHLRDLAYKHEASYTYNDKFTRTIPQKFIKGLPILDADDNLVTHSFLTILTHTLTIKVTRRPDYMPRPLQYGYLLPQLFVSIDDPSNKSGTLLLTTKGPARPLVHKPYSRIQTRLRPKAWVAAKPNEIDSKIASTLTLDQDLEDDNETEIAPERFSAYTGKSVPTKTFL